MDLDGSEPEWLTPYKKTSTGTFEGIEETFEVYYIINDTYETCVSPIKFSSLK